MENSNQKSKEHKFSIEYILKFAGKPTVMKNVEECTKSENFKKEAGLVVSDPDNLSWIFCSRFSPPKTIRSQQRKNGAKKRRTSRQARIPFTSEQISILEEQFYKMPYLNAIQVKQISAALQISETRVKIWFQNRRAREKREQKYREEGNVNFSVHFSKSESHITRILT